VTGSVDLYWLPLGAGGRCVSVNGRVYEAAVAAMQHRRRHDLYHSALEVCVPAGRFVIEMTPIRDGRGRERGVVAEGAVGSTLVRRLRLFRYENRRWRDGCIPDAADAVESPRRLTSDCAVARRLLELVSAAPTPVWGRDELHTGEMWNSNALVSWLIVSAGLDPGEAHLPRDGRAPGWRAGIVVARRMGGDGIEPPTSWV
jgi:hypothetical protein